MTATCAVTSFVIEMLTVGSKIGAKNNIMPNRNDMTRGTMITMALSMTSLTNSTPLKEGAMKESKPFPMT
jgi:hypothetical protein